jgi:hypothetical protein
MNPLSLDEQVLQSELPMRVNYWAEWYALSKSQLKAFIELNL